MAERDPLRGALAGLDAGEARDGERIALGQSVLAERSVGLSTEPHFARSARAPIALRFA